MLTLKDTFINGDLTVLGKLKGKAFEELLAMIGNPSLGGSGKSLEFAWQGTSLGIRREGDESFIFVNLKGEPGIPGEDGKDATGSGIVNWADIQGKPDSFGPPIASGTIVGGVKIGSYLSIDASGVLSVSSFPTHVDSHLEDGNDPIPNATTNKSGLLSAEDKTKLDNLSSGDNVTSVAGRTGEVTLTKEDVGLNSVDNTADSAKNVFSATKLSAPVSISLTGDISGTIEFDGSSDVGINAELTNDDIIERAYDTTQIVEEIVDNNPSGPGITTTLKVGESVALSGDITIKAGANITITQDDDLKEITINSTVENDASLPPGGTAGQVLAKTDGTDFNAQWVDAPSGGESRVPTGSGVVDIHSQTDSKSNQSYTGISVNMAIKGIWWLSAIVFKPVDTITNGEIKLRTYSGYVLQTITGITMNADEVKTIELNEPVLLSNGSLLRVEVLFGASMKYNRILQLNHDGLLWKSDGINVNNWTGVAYSETPYIGLIEYTQ